MTDGRLSTTSPSSPSPGRPQPTVRPHWPWAAAAYRQQRSAQSSPLTGTPVQSSTNIHQSSWDGRPTSSPFTSQSSFLGSMGSRNMATVSRSTVYSNTGYAETTRHWSYTGFDWAVKEVHRLRDFVEGGGQAGDAAAVPDATGDFEILKQSPMIGDSKYKLEIAPTHAAEGSTSPPTLSLYITSLMLDFQGDFETSASMMAAIKCQDDRVGERGARPEWVWEYWQSDWVFRRESEVWECPLPSLSSLLEHSRIRETDSLVISVQIHCPSGPSLPQQPSVYYVPKDLLDGLEASLDNPNTGDVRFICLERLLTNDSSEPSTSPDHSSPSTFSPFQSYATARKRIIYAHADILTRRSEYFATMLSSAFAESSTTNSTDRKVYTIVVEEVDFETIYWLLKYCYANWLLFKQDDDPRIAVEGVGAGWNARWLTGQHDEWDWRTFRRGNASEETDTRSIASGESLPISSSLSQSGVSVRSEGRPTATSVAQTSVVPPQRMNPGPKSSVSTSTSGPSRTGVSTTTTTSRRGGASSPPMPSLNVSRPSQAGGSANISRPAKNNVPSNFSPPHFPVSPRTARSAASTPDPHPHPTPAPSPASALSIYQVAHRYAMPSLASLALEHIMSTISPQSAFALLLATSVWDELYSLIEDFVVDRWDEVSVSAEFEHCCKEVAAGEWGPDGGKTLMSVFRRLRSPST